MDITLPSMNELSSPNFSGLLPNCNSSTSVSLITPSTSPSRLLKDDGNQWLNPDVCHILTILKYNKLVLILLQNFKHLC